jgi:hypothetical protein
MRFIALAWLIQLALSWPLWYVAEGRSFPLLPVWGSGALPGWLHQVQAFGLVGLLLALSIWPRRPVLVVAALVWALWLVLSDLNRLQVWVYFYGLALLLHLPARWADFFKKMPAAQPVALTGLLAVVYGWSGLFKITPYFAEDNFPWLCSAFAWTQPFGQWTALGYGMGVFEMLLGPGLCWPPTRRLACVLAVAMHLLVVLVLSPWGLNWNAVVIPWNCVLIYLLYRIFAAHAHSQPIASSGMPLYKQWQMVVVLAAGVLPVLNPAGIWPDVLSWKMYSNTQAEWSVYAKPDAVCAAVRPLWDTLGYDGKSKLLLDDWSYRELGTPFAVGDLASASLRHHWCTCVTRPDSAGLLVLRVRPWRKNHEKIQYKPCFTNDK